MSTPRTKLFVGHLPDGCTNDDLFNLFSKYGNVKECDVINKYGFVHMSTSEEAQDALKALNNYYFRGSSLSVEPSKSKLHPEPGSQGRARGGSSRGRGYGGPRGGGGYANGYGRRYDGPPFGGRDFYDRGYSSMSARMRPYPSPYDRPSPSMGPMRDDYGDPYSPSLRDPYSSRTGMSPMSRDLYERRATTYPSASDYLYSRRSPTSSMDVGRSYWYNDSMGDSRRGYVEPLGDDGYGDGYSRKYDGPSYGEQDYYDHADSSMSAPRRPYPPPYDRPNPSVGAVRDDYADPYQSRSAMPPPMSRDLYERGATAYPSDADDLYSRRPAPSMDLGRMRMPSSAGPRPYF